MSNVVVVIPARGGSKGIHRKNLQPVGGIPLVGRAVRAALSANLVDRVYVSTEDVEIAAVAREYGAEVIDRPKKLATDEAPSFRVMHHAIDVLECQGEPADVLVSLECTYPLTTAADIDGAVEMFQADDTAQIVTTVCQDHSYQLRPGKNDTTDWVTFQRDKGDQRRQELPLTFKLAGGVVIWRAAEHRKQDCGFYGTLRLYEMPEERSIDIDTPVDLYMARSMTSYQNQWIVIGSSPSAPAGLRAALAVAPDARTITTNRGHLLFEGDDRPDVYHLHDSVACEEHRQTAVDLAAKGSHMTTLARASDRALKVRNVDWFDEFLTLVSHTHPGRYQHGVYASCGLSGLMILQYALNNGARTVHVVGLEGYADKGHYFDGGPDLTQKKGLAFTRDQIGPFVQSCVDACPEVQFTFYGELNYPIADGPNVTFVKELSCDLNLPDDGEATAPTTLETCRTGPQMC